LNYSFFLKSNYGSRYWPGSPRFANAFFLHFLKSDHLAELKPWAPRACLLLLCPVLASETSKQLGRPLKNNKNTFCESSNFIKKDKHSIGVSLFFFLIFSGASLGLWLGASGVPCGFSWAVLRPLGLVLGHPSCISGTLGRILAVHLLIWKVSRLLLAGLWSLVDISWGHLLVVFQTP
jgi:hypothetical protein